MGYLALRFDDGTISQYNFGYKYMKKYNMKGVIYPIINRIGKDNYINWNRLYKMQENNWEIGSHSMTHSKEWINDRKNIKYELKESLSILTEKGFDVNSFCFPFNKYNDNSIRKCLKYYKCCLAKYNKNIIKENKNIIPSVSSKEGIDKMLKVIKNISNSDGFQVITFHKISDENNLYNIPIKDFKKIIDYIQKFIIRDKIKVITIKEYLELF